MFWRGERKDRDFGEEIEAHIALEAERLRGEGLSESDAMAASRKQFGNVLSAQERFYEAGRWLGLERLLRDVSYGLRILARNPGFTAVALVSLALGIGVNALVFSVVNSLLLRPLPVDQPGQLVFLESARHGAGQSFPNYRDLRDRNQVFSGLLGFRVVQLEMESHESADRTWGYLATGNYFDLLGVKPALGRFFHQEDDLHAGASPYAVLSYGTWQSRFGGDREIVGKTIRINRQAYTVLGVAPPEFHGTELFYWPEVWVPMMMQAQIEPGNPWLEERMTSNTWIIGRLKPGVTPGQATANLNAISSDLAREYPAANEGMRLHLARPGLVGDELGRPVQAFSIGVLVLAGLVLLTACANLVSTMIARGADRQREIAIRLSIGATKGRIVRQLLTETIVLSSIGGMAGYGLAMLLARLLNAWRAPMDFPVQVDVIPDWRVFVFASVVSLLAGVVFGLAPARHAAGTDTNAVLKGEQPSWRGRRLAVRDLLVMGQVALCFVLVSACVLSLKGLQKSLTTHLGMRPEGVAIAAFDLGLAGYSEEKGREFQQQALRAVEHLPGVHSAAYSNSIPLSIDENEMGIVPEDEPNLQASKMNAVFVYQVSPGFFKALGMELLAGRDFNWHDDRNTPRVAIVNLAFAKQILHSENAVGKRFWLGPSQPLGRPSGPLVEVIGMAEDGKYESLTEPARPAMFRPMLQRYNTTTTLIVRSSLPESEMVAKMRQALAQLDAHLPLFGTGSLTQMLSFARLPMRAAAVALSAFGLLAVVLAVTGIHGLVSYAVARRAHEIGIRVAIGASPAHVIRLVLGRTLKLLAAGSAIGLLLALASVRLLASIVYQAAANDPIILATAVLTMAALGVLSSWAPMRRALRIDPTVALRHE
jgi:predicted permease